jgi:diguanylate cyclase (GGDEF)-like protein
VQWSLLLGEEPRPIDTTFEELSALVHPDDVAGLREQIKAMLKGDIPRYDVEHRVRTHSGAWKWIRSSGEVIERDRVGRALRAAGTNFDITARKEAEAELAHRAAHDGLTGLPNRILYFDRLEQAILRCRRSRALIAVMYLDIDRFKTINDTLGHARGDAVLQEVGSRLRRCVRATDTIARLGGDEFTLILEELNHRDNGVRIAEKIVAAIRAPFALEGGTIDTSTSVGIAFYDGAGSVSPDELVAAADRALYEAKRAGRDRFHVAG